VSCGVSSRVQSLKPGSLKSQTMSSLRLSALEKLILLVCYERYGVLSSAALLCDVDAAYEMIDRPYVRKKSILTFIVRRSLMCLFRKGLVDFEFSYECHGHKEQKQSYSLLAELTHVLRRPESFQEYYTALLERVYAASSTSPSRKLKKQITASRLLDADKFIENKQVELECVQRTGLPSRYTRIETIMLTKEGERAARRLNDKFQAGCACITKVLTALKTQTVETQARAITAFHLLYNHKLPTKMPTADELSLAAVTRGGNGNGSNVRTGQDDNSEESARWKENPTAGQQTSRSYN